MIGISGPFDGSISYEKTLTITSINRNALEKTGLEQDLISFRVHFRSKKELEKSSIYPIEDKEHDVSWIFARILYIIKNLSKTIS